tara:strand:- start:29 stop:691 length:663 start_codon:yes stop_codon:yes gene_type:complete
MRNIKAIIFDAYGTLFDVNSPAEKCKNKIGDKWELFSNYWRTTQLEYTWLRSLMGRHEDFWKITEDSLDKSMKVFQVNEKMKSELLDHYKILSTFTEVHETLRKLKEKKYRLIILSNGTPSLLKDLVSNNNLESIVDDILSVEVVKKYKPHPNVYNIPLKKYQIEKKQFAYLSANTWDVSAAGIFGFNSVWVNRNKNIFDNLDYEPSAEIKTLSDLNNLL